MNQAELVAAISNSSGLPKTQVETVLKRLGTTVQAALSGGSAHEVTLPGIGKLSLTHKAARTGRNPRTGEELQIAARNAPKFTAAKALKDAVN